MLRPEYTFENFVVTPRNELAYTSALMVADYGTKAIPRSNPLSIYGLDMDRYHLMQAIAHRASGRGLLVENVSFREFVAALKKSQQEDSLDKFRNRFRTPDFLLIDDIETITHYRQAQQEFFHTLDDLVLNSHQVVLSADRRPDLIALKRLEPELHSRFTWGLVVEINPSVGS